MRSEAAKDRIICTPAWVAPPPRVALPCDAVHVWRVGLIDPPDHVNHLAASLSPDERDRADRFHFERDRHRYVIGRGTLRAILGAYLGVPPGSLRFGYGPSGKPFVAEPADAARLQFNLSHAGALALVAVAHVRAVGVDLEQVRALPDRDLISTRFFSALERAALQALAPEARDQAFFACWTRKEALLKAWGDGLSFPLDRFAVSLAPGEPARLRWVEGGARAADRWQLRCLVPAPGYLGAVAAEGRGWRLRCWTWPGDGVESGRYRRTCLCGSSP